MAESMKGLKRTCRCTEVSSADIGKEVTVMGWVQKRRNLGSLIFVDLRDRSGILQLLFNEDEIGSEGYKKAATIRSEFVLAATGIVNKRGGEFNESLKTGDIEIVVKDLRILSESETPPFPIEENSQTKDDLRLKYRYLDLRRPDLQRNIILRSKVASVIRNYLDEEGFLEIETPMLGKSTPELSPSAQPDLDGNGMVDVTDVSLQGHILFPAVSMWEAFMPFHSHPSYTSSS